MGLSLGCAVWAYQPWVGSVYPPGSPAHQFLTLYSQRFPIVECNASFYAIPSRATLAKWVEATPAGFKFCPKLPRSITHQGRLVPQLPPALDFLELIQTLGDRLGIVFAQLPPHYGPQDSEDLATFLTALTNAGVQLAVEVRHRDWFQDPHRQTLGNLLRSLGIGTVTLDSRPVYEGAGDPQRFSQRRKPQLPVKPMLTAPYTLIRFISHPDWPENLRFLSPWLSYLKTCLEREIQVYFFMHCPVEDHSPDYARRFDQMLREDGLIFPPLPWDQLAPPPAQLDLFASMG